MEITCVIPQIQLVQKWKPEKTVSTQGQEYILKMPCYDERLINFAKNFSTNINVEIQEDVFAFYQMNKDAPSKLCEEKAKFDFHCVKVTDGCVEISAINARGLFYAMSTLLKLKCDDNSFPNCCFSDWAQTEIRCDYIEFRNFYPTFEHVLEYFEEMAHRHTNAVILEMEDKRPTPMGLFEKDLITGFSEAQINQICEKANECFLELIPLQQSFGHIEYVLKNEKHIKLREVPEFAGELCPTKAESQELSKNLIEDVSKVFPKSKYIHLGGDEVYHVNICEDCKKRNLTKNEIIIDFMNKMIASACDLGKQPLLWHDMLLSCTEQELSKLDKRVIIVVWLYDGNDLKYRANKMLSLLKQADIKVWGGCAVRCWDRSVLQNYPVLESRFANIKYWKELADEWNLKGMVNTNWSAISAISAPYGVYETAIYPSYFAAEQLWNRNADVESFLKRYLITYHAISDLSILQEGWKATDYFAIMPSLHSKVEKHKQISELLKAINSYEMFSQFVYPAHMLIHRVKRFSDVDVEWEALHGRYMATFNGLKDAKSDLQKALSQFLPKNCVDVYMGSRYDHWEILEKEIVRLAKEYGRENFEPILTAQNEV